MWKISNFSSPGRTFEIIISFDSNVVFRLHIGEWIEVVKTKPLTPSQHRHYQNPFRLVLPTFLYYFSPSVQHGLKNSICINVSNCIRIRINEMKINILTTPNYHLLFYLVFRYNLCIELFVEIKSIIYFWFELNILFHVSILILLERKLQELKKHRSVSRASDNSIYDTFWFGT